jgi:hypothetical protein
MSWVAAAIVGGAAIGAGGAYLASEAQGEAMEGAAATQASAANRAADVQWQMYEQSREDYAPYREMGAAAVPYYQYLTTGQAPEGFDPSGLFDTPGYKFQQQQTEQAILRAQAAGGDVRGSATMGAFGRAEQAAQAGVYGRLLDAINVGRGATTAGASAGTAAAGNISNIYQQQGMNAANMQIAQGQNRASLYSNLSSLPLNLYSTYMTGGGYGGGGGGGYTPPPGTVPFNPYGTPAGGQTPIWM